MAENKLVAERNAVCDALKDYVLRKEYSGFAVWEGLFTNIPGERIKNLWEGTHEGLGALDDLKISLGLSEIPVALVRKIRKNLSNKLKISLESDIDVHVLSNKDKSWIHVSMLRLWNY